jgi:hypothetical protein
MVNILGSFREVKDSIDGLSPGKYLFIESNIKDSPIPILYEEFMGLFAAAKSEPLKNKPLIEQVGLATDFDLIPTKKQLTNFDDLMAILAKKIEIIFPVNEDELVVTSSEEIFLQLPWEVLVKQKIFVYREVIVEDDKNFEEKPQNNLMFLVSHATKDGGTILKPIKEGLDDEIREVYSLISSIKTDEMANHLKFNKVLLSIHTTRDSLNDVHWNEFNYAHLIMHGLEDGRICLESPDDHKQIEGVTIPEFIKLIEKHSFKLFFLSFCYSGGGTKSGDNLSYLIVRKGISKYVIGYSYSVDGRLAASFAKCFYAKLLNGAQDGQGNDKIKSIYKEALEKYYVDNPGAKDLPFLYLYK